MPYSEIVITAPSSASHSDVVDFSVRIKNIITTIWVFRVYCWVPDQLPESQVLYDEVYIDAGATKTYPLSFFMPNKNAEIFVWVERLKLRPPLPAEWPYDNAAIKEVALVVGVKYEGTITRKQLDYDAVRVPFPVQ